MERTCEIDGCGRPFVALGMCRKHYNASRYIPRPRAPRSACSVDGCDQQASCKGLCGAHYQRKRRFGDPTFMPPAPVRICSVPDCGKVPNARGLCATHYYRWFHYGDPMFSRNQPRASPSYAIPQKRPCATCGRPFDDEGRRARKYCGKSCKPSGRIAGSVNKRTWVERLGREDGWVCRICDGPINPGTYWPDPQCGSVDHIVMVKDGGTDARDNLRLTHLRCNVGRKS